MKHGIISKAGLIICDPIPYSADRFHDIINRHGGNPAAIPDKAPQGLVDCGPLQILPSAEINTPAPNKHAYQQRFTAWAVVGDKLQRETEWHLLPDDQIRQNLLGALAEIRWQYETAGMTVGDVTVKTDRESRGLIFDSYNSLKDGFVSTGRFKFADGNWQTVTAEQMKVVAAAVAQRTDAAFRAEEAVGLIINDATDIAALLAIDLKAAFDAALTP